MLCLPVGLLLVITMVSNGLDFDTIVEVLVGELLDLGRIRATFEPATAPCSLTSTSVGTFRP